MDQTYEQRLTTARGAVHRAARELERALNELPTDASGRPVNVQLDLSDPELLEINELLETRPRYLVGRGYSLRLTFHHTERVYP